MAAAPRWIPGLIAPPISLRFCRTAQTTSPGAPPNSRSVNSVNLLIDRCCHDSGARIDLARVPAGLNLLLMVMLMRTHYL
jgi:hypothetical protein